MNGYEAIAQILKLEGVEWMACFPSNPLIEYAAKAGIRPIMFRQERGGVMAADGFSRLRHGRGFGVFASQGGPGTENSFGGIAQAWADAVPIIYFPDASGDYRSTVKPIFSASRYYERITKWAHAPSSSGDSVPMMRRAFHALKNGRPGPVLYELHRDVMEGEVSNLDSYKSPQALKSPPTHGAVKDAVTALLKASKPAIWAGQGVLYAEATNELAEFAELTQIPVMTTMPAKGAIPDDHPLALGAANRTAPKAVWTWLKDSDALFGIGTSFTVTNYGIDVPSGKFMIHATNNWEDISKEYPTDVGICADAKLTLQAMIDEVKSQAGENGRRSDQVTQEDVAEVKEEWVAEWSSLLNSKMTPMNPYRLIHEINRAVDHENTVMTHDAGHPRDQIMPFYRATVPHSYIGWGKTTHLGYGIPLMIGAKMAMPDRHCINFMGDAAFGMSGLDIETAVRAGVPITTIVMNNGTMGGYSKNFPVAMEEFEVAQMTGDYAKIAEGLGAVGIKIESPEEVVPAIKKARSLNDDGRSVLLDVKTQEENRMAEYQM